jgi:antitoxin (DNA-binding transcriptional repressor) of toxin-antitoxin stability system
MEKKIKMDEAETNFREIIAAVLKGTDVIIIDDNIAVAKIVRIKADENVSGADKWTSDDFDIKLPNDK